MFEIEIDAIHKLSTISDTEIQKYLILISFFICFCYFGFILNIQTIYILEWNDTYPRHSIRYLVSSPGIFWLKRDVRVIFLCSFT